VKRRLVGASALALVALSALVSLAVAWAARVERRELPPAPASDEDPWIVWWRGVV
jgi:hypothetical protein